MASVATLFQADSPIIVKNPQHNVFKLTFFIFYAQREHEIFHCLCPSLSPRYSVILIKIQNVKNELRSFLKPHGGIKYGKFMAPIFK